MKRLAFLLLSGISLNGSYAQNLLWARGAGGPQADIGAAIAVDASGNVYTAGSFNGTADFDPGPSVYNLTAVGGADAFISKLDAQGNFVWAKSLGGTGTDFASGIAVDGLGNAYVTGSYSSTVDFDPGSGIYNMTSAGMSDCFILSLDAGGNLVWAKSIGDGGFDQGAAIAVDGSGNIYIAGGFDTSVDLDPGVGLYNLTAGYVDVFVCKLDNAGSFLWARGMGGPGLDYPLSVSADAMGNVYTSGYFRSAGADFDPGAGTYNLSAGNPQGNGFISKLDASGAFQWASGFLGAGICYANCVKSDAAGNVFITGAYSGNIDFDPGSGNALSASQGGTPDAYVASLDASGNYAWSKFISSTAGDQGLGLVTDASGNLFVSGYFSGTADFDPGPAVLNRVSGGGTDLFITGYDGSGNYVSAYTAGSTGADNVSALAIDAAGNLYAAGAFQNSVSFDANNLLSSAGNSDASVLKFQSCSALGFTLQPANQVSSVGAAASFTAAPSVQGTSLQWQADAGLGFTNLSNAGQYSGVNSPTLTISALTLAQNAVKFRCLLASGNCSLTSATASLAVTNDVGLREWQLEHGWTVYPNPASDKVVLRSATGLTALAYKVYDQTGRVVLSGMCQHSETVIEISSLPAGPYLLQVPGSFQKPVTLMKQ